MQHPHIASLSMTCRLPEKWWGCLIPTCPSLTVQGIEGGAKRKAPVPAGAGRSTRLRAA